MMHRAVVRALVWVAVAAPVVAGAEEVEILGTMGAWRMHHTLAPPVVGGEPLQLPQRWLNRPTAPPSPDWTAIDFDDSAWGRGTAARVARSPYLSRLSLRAGFEVTDPAAPSLRLSVDYHGGAVVYLNGVEIVRADLPAGALTDRTLARPYPTEAFITAEGEYLAPAGAYLNGKPTGRPSVDSLQRMAGWVRRLDGVKLPRKLLRKGRNLLAIRIVRAPYDKALRAIGKSAKGSFPCEFTWDTCSLLDIRLTAAGGGVVPNLARPKGLQAWVSNAMAGDFDLDFADATEPVGELLLTGAANGSFSGKVVLGSTEPIRNLEVVAGPLTGSAGVIAASNVRIRYARRWGSEALVNRTYHGQRAPYPAAANLLDMLVDSPPAEIPVCAARPRRGKRAAFVPGALVPIWATVRVPAKAAAGVYRGALTIRAAGAEAVIVPIKLTVADWVLPVPGDYRTWIELIQSPDTLAVEYGVELWSPAHWELIGKSMDFLKEVGSRVIYTPLLAHTNLGNAESMVQWIDKGEGRYGYDFSIFDRYLDLACERMGRPKLVVFNVWDVYMIPAKGGRVSGGTSGHRRMVDSFDKGSGQARGFGPLVTVVDPADGARRNVHLPSHFEPGSLSQWKPLFDQLRVRMRRRGLEQAMSLGMVTDARPTRQEVQRLGEITGGLPWVSHGHGGFGADQTLHNTAPIRYQACVWYTQFADQVPTHGRTWGDEPMYGWRQKQLTVAFERNTALDGYPMTRWRQIGPSNITGGQRGAGRMGADFWPVIKDKRGRRRGTISQRYPESLWMNLNIPNAVLAPGPDGPVATTRYEALREGVQECEARIFIEKALTAPAAARRLGGDLASRARALLAERTDAMWKSLSNLQLTGPGWANGYGWRWTPGVSGHLWFVGSGWRERNARLYALAGEVAAKLGDSR